MWLGHDGTVQYEWLWIWGDLRDGTWGGDLVLLRLILQILKGYIK